MENWQVHGKNRGAKKQYHTQLTKAAKAKTKKDKRSKIKEKQEKMRLDLERQMQEKEQRKIGAKVEEMEIFERQKAELRAWHEAESAVVEEQKKIALAVRKEREIQNAVVQNLREDERQKKLVEDELHMKRSQDQVEQEKKVKKEKKDKKENKSMNAGKRDDDNDSEVDKRKKEKKDKKEKNDKKPHKKAEEQNEGMSMAVNGRGVDEDSEVEELQYDSDEIQDVIKTLSEFVASKGGNPAVALFLEELRMQQLAKIFDNKVRLYVAIQALFGTTIPAKEIPGKAKYLTKVIQNGNMSPQDILWGFEVYLVNNPATEKQYPRTLKGLYDADIVTEEQLLEHYKGDFSTPGFATAKKAAKPFLDWLEQESEASDSDSDEN